MSLTLFLITRIMKKQLFIILFLVVQNSWICSAQETFSRIYDLDTNAIRNYAKDLAFFDDEIYLATVQFCDADAAYIECSVLTKLESNGDIIENRIRIESNGLYFVELYNSSIRNVSKIVVEKWQSPA